MSFFDDNFKEWEHHPDAQMVRTWAKGYLKTKKVGNNDKFAAGVYGESLANAIYSDMIQDKDPRKSALGAYFYSVFQKTKASGSTADFLRKFSDQMAFDFYAAKTNYVVFDPTLVKPAFFQEMLGRAAKDGAVAYLKAKDPTSGKGETVEAVATVLGQVFVDRLSDPYKVAQILDPNKWAMREGQRIALDKALDLKVQAAFLQAETELLNAQTLKKMAQHNAYQTDVKIFLERGQGALTKDAQNLAHLSLLEGRAKWQLAAVAVGGALLLTGLGFAMVRR